MTRAVFRIVRLALHARHGVLEAERTLGQHFFLDLSVSANVDSAIATDRLEDSVSYGEVVDVAAAVFTARSFNLIETAAAAVADALLERFPSVVDATVTVHKPS